MLKTVRYYAEYLLLIPLLLTLAPFAGSVLELKEAALQIIEDHKQAYSKNKEF